MKKQQEHASKPANGTRFSARFCTIAAAAMMLFGCDDSGPIKIGFIAGISGDGADTGIAALHAMELAAQQVNEKGGIHGRSLEIIARDDQKNPETAQAAVREFKELGVTAIIGPIISSIGMAMLPVINELDIVAISPTASAAEFTGLRDNFFRMNSTTRENADAYARRNIDKGRMRISLALDGENEAFTESWYREFLLTFDKLGGRVVSKVWFNTADTTKQDVARQLRADSPDAIIFIANGVDSAELAKEIRKIDRDIPLSTAEWAGTEQLITFGGDAVEGMELLQTYDRYATNPHYQKFVADYRNKFNEQPGYTSVLAYDAMTVLVAALETRAPDQPLSDALVTLPPQQGLHQELMFDQFGDGKRDAYFVKIKNGQFILE
ncbi:ABC transporter substrate-binding protein [Thalassospira permensis]|uniref:ABC transporter substrate-binding protein n=1 Tax=Thalassospira permensis NBRC 106175 TaxID=1353532 RepID=A0ABR4TNS2_9PROT|nr:ABC transporter substrate-binding protein [Thalassospira permensis]KEO57060.1 ABC transporter substrate-binding protein [Thalassospira permensis NBRC 106175]